MYRHVSSETSKYKDSSSESDRSSDSSSEESSEEVVVIRQTTQATTTVVTTTDSMTTSAITHVTMEDRSTISPQPETDNTDKPIERETTPPAGTPSTPIPKSSSSVTHRVTSVIPTEAPITENRGDN